MTWWLTAPVSAFRCQLCGSPEADCDLGLCYACWEHDYGVRQARKAEQEAIDAAYANYLEKEYDRYCEEQAKQEGSSK